MGGKPRMRSCTRVLAVSLSMLAFACAACGGGAPRSQTADVLAINQPTPDPTLDAVVRDLPHALAGVPPTPTPAPVAPKPAVKQSARAQPTQAASAQATLKPAPPKPTPTQAKPAPAPAKPAAPAAPAVVPAASPSRR